MKTMEEFIEIKHATKIIITNKSIWNYNDATIYAYLMAVSDRLTEVKDNKELFAKEIEEASSIIDDYYMNKLDNHHLLHTLTDLTTRTDIRFAKERLSKLKQNASFKEMVDKLSNIPPVQDGKE